MVRTSGATTMKKSLAVLEQIPAENIVLTSSRSLLHVPFTTANEEFEPAILNHFAFAVENSMRSRLGCYPATVKVQKPQQTKNFAAERVGENANFVRIAGD